MEEYVTYVAPNRKRFLKINFYIANNGCMYLMPQKLSHWSAPRGLALSEEEKEQALQQTMEMIPKQSEWQCEISPE